MATHKRPRRTTGRVGGALAVAFSVVAVAVIALSGQAGAQVAVPVSFEADAMGTLSSCGGPNLIQFTFTGTADIAPFGTVSTLIEVCTDVTDTSGPTTPILPGGTFTFTTSEGSFSGTVSGFGSNVATPEGFPIYNLLTVTSGTGLFVGATGTIEIRGFAQFPPSSFSGTASGTLLLRSPTPQSKEECKDGGWRNLADAEGRPFKNQGRCVSFVVSR